MPSIENLEGLDNLIETAHEDLAGMPLDDARHETALSTLERLHAVRRADIASVLTSVETNASVAEKILDGAAKREIAAKPPIDRNTVIGAGASLGGILMIISAERAAVIATKALGFVGKNMIRIV